MRPRTILITALVASASLVAAARAGDCPSDANNDGVVGINDMLQILTEWGCTDCPDSDISGDGIVGINDFLQVLTDWGCEANTGPVTALSGTVTNLWTGEPIEGASVDVGGEIVVTDAAGEYSGEFPPGIYEVGFEAEYFFDAAESIVLFPDLPAALDAELEPVAAVIVNVLAPATSEPGETIEVTAEVIVLDGSEVLGFDWMQVAGADALIGSADTDTVTVDLASRAEYKVQLAHVLKEPPISPDDLPPNVPPPPDEFPAGLQDRFQVVGVNPFALEEAGLVMLEVDVTTSSGVYTAEGEVHAHLPWRVTTGLRNVPLNVPVLLQGKTQAAYDWAIGSKPVQSSAVMIDQSTQNPDFTPDWPGLYEITVTDQSTPGPLVIIPIYAGNWRGIIVGQDAEGRPVSDPDCLGCHANLGIDKFTPWSQTGHAEIFTNNLNTSTHYGENCFVCHTVGYDPEADNNGVDEQPDWQDFLDSGLLNNPGDNWTTMLAEYPWSAQMSNAQCENCHGPQWGFLGSNGTQHGPAGPQGEPRVSLSADVCATCHGEPLRHARYQQWQFSGHANYELAIEEGGSGNCSRCHTVNGFLTWLPVLLGDEPGDPLDSIEVTWTADETHPQTCATCHDPHNVGTTSGIDTNATVRISGNTPPLIAGFTAYGVGRGALCMTCHNSRRGLRNDDVFDEYYGTSEAARAPHGSAQTDLLMGENAYLVAVGIRGNHSFVTDACVACHMEETPPPDQLSYNEGGTNHTFFASSDICANCHGPAVDADYVQGGVQDTLDILQAAIEDALLAYIGALTAEGKIVDLDGAAQVTDAADLADLEFGEFRGRQAITVTFADQTVLGPFRMTDIDILDSGGQLIEGFYDTADPGLIKAGWNWALVNNDGSRGVHNPTYAYTVMVAAIEAVSPGAAGALELPQWLEPGWITNLRNATE